MSTIKSVVHTVKALDDFVSVIKGTGITVDEMSELSMLKPDFSETMGKIKCWVVAPADKTLQPDQQKRKYVLTSEKACREIAKYVADSCNGVVVDEAVRRARERFKGISPGAIRRIVRKKTFIGLTDGYYTIIDGIIHKN